MVTGFLEFVLIAVIVVVVYPFLKDVIESVFGKKHSGVVTVLSVLSAIYVFNFVQGNL